MGRITERLKDFFWHLQDLYHQLKPCRFSFIIALLGAIVFLWVDQGTEVLRALAEPGRMTGTRGAVQLTAFAVGLVIWSLVSWYSARVLLYFDFETRQVWHPSRHGLWLRVHHWSQRNVPRILGAAPMWLIGISLLQARGTYEKDPPASLLHFGLLAIAAGCVLWALLAVRRAAVVRRQIRIAQPGAEMDAKSRQVPPSQKKFAKFAEMERTSRLVIGAMGLLSLVLLFLFTFNPVRFAGGLGTGALLMFAAASWVFWGSALVYFGGRHHLPILSFLAAWLALCSLHNDNHDVRTIARRNAVKPADVQTALDQWHKHVVQKYPSLPVHPLFIVASEGGGIRAAYWTASVLGSLQDTEPSFADHVLAISGVSGGSVGAAVFAALLADANSEHEMASRAQAMLGRDFLSPAIAAMLYPDFLQRFLPWPFPFLDRGRWLEKSWEEAWRQTNGTNRFAQPFSDLWSDPGHYVPALFLNGTSVETGTRVIVSNLVINNGYLGAEAAAGKYGATRDLPLSTAAHLSARFTYVSPAGRFSSDGSHVVDGGYFENSGATTALDILRRVNRILTASGGQLGDIDPKIIMISNDPLGTGSGTRRVVSPGQNSDETPTTKRDAEHNQPGVFLEDALAPMYALLSTREARGIYAQRAIGEAQKTFSEKLGARNGETDKTGVYFFSLAPAPVPLPLGWMLSNGAAQAMQGQLNDLGASTKTHVQTWNKAMREQIVMSLGGNVR